MPEFLAIGAACKRMRNILRQAEEKGIAPAVTFDTLPDSAPEEKNLAAYIEVNGPRVEALRKKKEYGDALMLLVDRARAGRCIFRQSDGDGRG